MDIYIPHILDIFYVRFVWQRCDSVAIFHLHKPIVTMICFSFS
jgi:hypothetical protein